MVRTRGSSGWLIGTIVLTAACGDGGKEAVDAAREAVDAAKEAVDAASRCDPTLDAAHALTAFQTCSTDDNCQLVDLTAVTATRCLAAFQCTRALAKAADLDKLRALATRYDQNIMTCGHCETARCIRADQLTVYCDPVRKLCTDRLRDAGPD